MPDAIAIVSTVLALMPQATGDAPMLSSLATTPGGEAVGALTSTLGQRPPARPASLAGTGAFACSRNAARLRCSLTGVRSGHRVRVDYVAFPGAGISRAHVSAARRG